MEEIKTIIGDVHQEYYVSDILLSMFGKRACVQMLSKLIDDALDIAQARLEGNDEMDPPGLAMRGTARRCRWCND